MGSKSNERREKKLAKNKMKLSRHGFFSSPVGHLMLEIVGVFVLCGLFVGAISTSALDNFSSTTSITVMTSCQMASVVDIPHTASLAGGLYEPDIGKTTITTTCNDTNGYAVYAIGFSNTEFGRTDLLGANTGRTIPTGTATSGGTSNWAMKLTAVAGTYQPTIASDTAGSFASYHAVPSEYAKVADYASSTDAVTGSKIETTYATYITSTQSPDTYNGKVKYTLIHPSDNPDAPCGSTYSIVYNANGGSGSMDGQTACMERSIALLPSGFTAPDADHKFAGWNTAADGSGAFYVAGQTVADLTSADQTVTLYAVWGPKYIQDLTASTCSKIASGVATTVYDRRDGSDYKVRYIAGACWMTQNLRITGVVNQQYSNFDRVENFDVCEEDLSAGDSVNQARCHDSGNTTTGVSYNYAAATAGQITGDSNSAGATQDICPTGWYLPIYNTAQVANPGTIQSMIESVAQFSPINGTWWSATAQGSSFRYCLSSNGSNLYITDNRRYNGFHIRCVRTQ